MQSHQGTVRRPGSGQPTEFKVTLSDVSFIVIPASLLNLLTQTPQLDVRQPFTGKQSGGRRDAMSQKLRGMSFEEARRKLAPDPTRAQTARPVEGSSPEPSTPAGVGPSSVVPRDQHKFDHSRSWAFCGIATMAMAMDHHGIEAPTDTTEELNDLAQGMYTPGTGTSGSGMAKKLQNAGVEGARFTTTGSPGSITQQLAAGGVVPMGVTNLDGVVEELPEPSKNYPALKVGSRHTRQRYGNSGHWVLVVGMEGKPEAPTAFLVNDPDTGARLRMTPGQLEKASVAHEGIWMVGYGAQTKR